MDLDLLTEERRGSAEATENLDSVHAVNAYYHIPPLSATLFMAVSTLAKHRSILYLLRCQCSFMVSYSTIDSSSCFFEVWLCC